MAAITVALALLALATSAFLAWGWARHRRLLARSQALVARQQAIFDALPNGIVVYDREQLVVAFNRDFVELYAGVADLIKPGVRFETLLRATIDRGLIPEAKGREEAWLQQRLALHGRLHEPVLRQTADGRWRRIAEVSLPDGAVLAFSVDVTELVQKEQALEAAHHRLEDAIQALPASFELFDAEDRLVMHNPQLVEMYPFLAEIVEKRPTFEEMVRHNVRHGGLAPHEANRRIEAYLAARRAGGDVDNPPRLHQLADGRWIRIRGHRTRDGGRVAIRVDITESIEREQALTELNRQLDAANAELQQLSRTDSLTGLANRREFDRHLADEAARAHRHQHTLALLLIDVDHFKAYNDRHGHPAGDLCLQRVTGVLQQFGRRPGELAARVGGEEFALVLPHHDLAAALACGERLLAAIDDEAIPHGAAPAGALLSCSVGVAALATGTDPAALIDAADRALYEAKRAGRHRVMSMPQR